MKSEWRVTSNIIGDRKMYAVYQIIDTSEEDHSGNRNFASGFLESREEAQALADILNEQDEVGIE